VYRKVNSVIRIVIADNDQIFRYGLRERLNLEDDLDIIGEAADGYEALQRVRDLDPDVLLLDLRMPNLDGLTTLQILQESHQRSKVIVLTASEDKKEFTRAMNLGCSRIVLKQSAPELIVKNIRAVHSGEILLEDSPAPTRGGSELSRREIEIVQLVAQGLRNKEIADKLFVTEQTVKNHVHAIFGKLRVSGRLELALYAIHKGLHMKGICSEADNR
jgi:DNA-binding NarL/FixJ family response regulator